jgi:hypothetical protein
LTADNVLQFFDDSVDFLELAEGDQSESLEASFAFPWSEDFDDFSEL